MTERGKRVAVTIGVALALVPLLLFTYFGLHTRLVIDDYAYLGLARQIGNWEAMLHWREALHGDYSNFLLLGLLSPLAERAAPFFSLTMMTGAFVGYCWLINVLLSFLQISSHRRKNVVALASLSLAATINGFYTVQSFMWMSAAVEYTWPAVMLLLGMALAVETGRRLRGNLQHALAAVAAAFYAFVNAGFSEMYVVFQLALVALLAVYVYAFQHGPKRRTYLNLAVAACLGTVASLLVQGSAPGVAAKMSSTEVYGYRVLPVHDIAGLTSRTFALTLQYAGHQAGFAGFMLAASAGLFATLSADNPIAVESRPRKMPPACTPTAFGLVVQLLFVPILWSHSSDNPQVFSRFSFAYFTVICINTLAILVLAALLWRRRLDRLLKKRYGSIMHCGSVLFVVCLFFTMTQVRSIHFVASSYLFFSALAMLIMIAGQLTLTVAEPRLNKAFQTSLFVAACTILALSAQLAAMLWGAGFIIERTLAAVSFVLTIAGLMIGATLGALIQRGFTRMNPSAVWRQWIRLFCLVFASTIAAGIVVDQAQRIGHVRDYAEAWDADHQTIIRLREEGDPAVYTTEFVQFPRDLNRIRTSSEFSAGALGWMQRTFYGLDYEPDIENGERPILE